ncbi:lysozyme inhibitor LprI family protein [Providencia rettgeri]|uniref:lysozyme inhibitor LprI family protein n=1 Tax=Providencia rustigianii TaxID=158850 RepID=UPI0034E68279
MKRQFFYITCIIGMSITQVYAASFDCELETLNPTEITICETPYLNGIDNVLNGLFIKAEESTLAKGSFYKEQKKWLTLRNKCVDNVPCIKEAYIKRNEILSKSTSFEEIATIFDSEYDQNLKSSLVNKYHFKIVNDPWRIKKLLIPTEIERELGMSHGYWRILTHRIIKNDLVIFFYVETKNTSYIVAVAENDNTMQGRVIADHDSRTDEAPKLTIVNQEKEYFTYSVEEENDVEGNKLEPEYYQISLADDLLEPQKVPKPDGYMKAEPWVGYCESTPCTSISLSPNKKWRVASSIGEDSKSSDGLYYFPSERPDLGTNVLSVDAIDFTHPRDEIYDISWQTDDIFYFGYTSIWKVDIGSKRSEKILPIRGIENPYYFSYAGEDYIISQFYPYHGEQEYLYGFYISKK